MSRRTIARTVEIAGTGLHTGADISFRLDPAPAGRGIVFVRQDLGGGRSIPATLEAVAGTERRTALRNGAHRADTVEHLLAVIHALEIDDVTITLQGPEVPILDGSFAPFVSLLDRAGRVDRPGPVRHARISNLLRITEGDALYRVHPSANLELAVTLDYVEPVIGKQKAELTLTAEAFRTEIQSARTFGFLKDVEPLRMRGLLGGASGDCAIVLDEASVLNTTLQWPDEFARHKMGDLIGDLTLLGARLHARVESFRPSHRGNIACARAIARAACFTLEEG
ncbi:MAG TPA: UDP-3-O-acyl-N-acetylglucosamine deacetylase [Gemmatimonadales bacterium]